MFGNVDKQGRLDTTNEDEIAKDLRELLQNQETAEYLNKTLAVPSLGATGKGIEGCFMCS